MSHDISSAEWNAGVNAWGAAFKRKRAESLTAPAGSASGINYSIDTKILTNGIIEMELRNATDTISRWVINTRDESTRKALIALGWTPPP